MVRPERPIPRSDLYYALAPEDLRWAVPSSMSHTPCTRLSRLDPNYRGGDLPIHTRTLGFQGQTTQMSPHCNKDQSDGLTLQSSKNLRGIGSQTRHASSFFQALLNTAPRSHEAASVRTS
ncbi:hypothetical protein PAPYR_13084 [Paratrimastix pyriformis]|uniref:Uncharacterized protein n=1 Tax=Paratrimastix pyriformis TaxID=342808 RepID=A0ABQ8U0T8_9EUKA|nr:hypothetical protein PAPYR_13084 [Paratrimastix pyriformis]